MSQGSQDNLFDVLDLATDEVANSRFLYWLMRPDAEHGQGPDFLKALLDATRIIYSPDWLQDYGIRREYRGKNAVIDIVIFKRGTFVIYVEHKIWSPAGAGDDLSQAQLNREMRDLRHLAGRIGARDNFFAVYLAPQRKLPPGGEAWVLLNHAELLHQLRQVAVQLPKVKYVLSDWIDTAQGWVAQPTPPAAKLRVKTSEDLRLDRLVAELHEQLSAAEWWNGWQQVARDREVAWSISHKQFWEDDQPAGSFRLHLGFDGLKPSRLFTDLDPPHLWIWVTRQGRSWADSLRPGLKANLLVPETLDRRWNYVIRQPVRQWLFEDREEYFSRLQRELFDFFNHYARLLLQPTAPVAR